MKCKFCELACRVNGNALFVGKNTELRLFIKDVDVYGLVSVDGFYCQNCGIRYADIQRQGLIREQHLGAAKK